MFVERLRAALCFEATEAARFLGAWRAANLERFFCDLADGAGGGRAGRDRCCAGSGAPWRKRRRPSAEPTAPGSLDAVTVVTLHGAKGLDWGHVYLMQLHKGAARAVAPGEVGRVDGALETPLVRLPDARVRRGAASGAQRVAEAERVRTLYVGMTRARERLVVSGLWPEFMERGGDDSHAALLARPRSRAARLGRDRASRASTAAREAAGACWVIPALRAPESAAAVERADGRRTECRRRGHAGRGARRAADRRCGAAHGAADRRRR